MNYCCKKYYILQQFINYILFLGASLALITYDGRFELGLNVNKALLSQEQAQSLVDDVVKNLYLLNDEIQKRYS